MAYRDRPDAGRTLAKHLEHLKDTNPLVLGVPRGGIVVAAEVAKHLKAELDVVISRKIGAPGNPELAVGAVDPDGEILEDPGLAGFLAPGKHYLEQMAQKERGEIARRLSRYRGDAAPISLEGRNVIIVDDGIATGLTIAATLRWAKGKRPRELTLAVPVAPPSTLKRMEAYADNIVCPLKPPRFLAVGQFYAIFDQTRDEEVIDILRGNKD